MIIPKHIIELAIEGGLKKKYLPTNIMSEPLALYNLDAQARLLLVPQFWQALGKRLGWSGEKSGYQAHVFYDLLLTKGDTDKFWEELTKKV